MKTRDFNISMEVEAAPEKIFDAINDVRGWWSEDIEGNTNVPGEEFRYQYKDVHQCRIRVVHMVPGKKVEWHVIDNYFKFVSNKKEWKDTKIVFEIEEDAHRTRLRFRHVGLVPEYECFDICRDAWTNYIRESLYNLITTGKGAPNPREGGFNEWLLGQHTGQGNATRQN